MNSLAKLSLAGLVCAVIATGTLVASANAGADLAAASTLSAHSVGTMVALNPQPLPPFVDGDEDDFLRG